MISHENNEFKDFLWFEGRWKRKMGIGTGSFLEKREVLPETLIVQFCPTVQPFKRKSIIFVSPCTKTLPKSTKKDTFHNFTFHIDKNWDL
jgi:hypothetical protein